MFRYILRLFAAIALFISLLASALPSFSQQRAIRNSSMEDPTFANNQFFFFSEGTVPGWLTSHPTVTNGCSNGSGTNNINCRAIERWSNTFNGVSTATGAGSIWAELNAYNNSMIYQTVCLASGESLGYSFVHRGRGSATIADVAQFRIGIPSGLPAGSKPADSYDLPVVQVSTTNNGTVTAAPTGNGTINAPQAAGNGWVRYSGTYTYTGATQAVNIGFAAVSTSGGNLAIGNFIDDWQIDLIPYVEVAAVTAAGVETTNPGGSSTPAGGPSIRVGGSLPSPVTVTVGAVGGTAAIGIDYSLTVPFSPLNTTNTVNVVIPPGVYDGASASSIFPVPFSVNPDDLVEPDETVQFEVTGVTGATLASVTNCGAAPATAGTYTIQNDDVITAGEVSLSGRVLTADGLRGVPGAVVTVAGQNGQTISTRTNAFGFFSVEGLDAGAGYLVSVSAKGLRFSPRAVTLEDDLSDFDFVAQGD